MRKKPFGRTQVCNTGAKRKIEQLPLTVHLDPRALAFHNDPFCEVAHPFFDMALRKLDERGGHD